MISFKHSRVRGIFFTLQLLITAGFCKAQVALTPGNIPFDTKFLKTGKYEMGCFIVDGAMEREISSFIIDINANKETLSIYTTLYQAGSDDPRVDTIISDGKTFTPLYRSSFNSNYELQLKYGKEVTGYHYDKQSRKKRVIKEPVTEAFFDGYCYPYLLGLLPLTSGYSANMPVYDYRPENTNNLKKALIEEVTSGMYTSSLTGAHKVWLVTVFEEATKDKYVYHIDKETRRLWKVDIHSNAGQHILMVDRETDFNPFKNTFDKVATMKLIKSGSAVISGQAFAKDNENEGMLKGIAVLNINKKQFAPTGTSIVLIPYTDFFKEWVKLNESSRKKGRAVPLPKEAAECIKTATVYDDKGHFEFVNLMPGDYLIFAEFGYVHTSRRTEVVGYTDTYVNGLYQGTRENTTVRSYAGNAGASVKKVVTIEKEGEKVDIKLKKTL
ncbi:phenylpyruvate tautomerase PptA (4-oxalocrotonate tautomerase family) [Chitinophaga sp. W2I13]|uniref:DUF3108 domain-containing protein n=1 Tax=Chitinophaga sp. W2I13 TaxID=3373923 RepID=UPI003D22C103